jgi:hypothetical protein
MVAPPITLLIIIKLYFCIVMRLLSWIHDVSQLLLLMHKHWGAHGHVHSNILVVITSYSLVAFVAKLGRYLLIGYNDKI